jgi:molybdopterin/thiamine biosynthesis adenylyltransferase
MAMRTGSTFSRPEGPRALVVGIGGLGCPAALALARSGVGTLGLVDPDTVDLSNLPRQLLYEEPDVGRPKVEVAAERLRSIAPATRFVTMRARFTGRDAAWLRDFDVVLDGTDSIAAKFEVSDAAVVAGVPLVHAGAIDFRAQLLTILPRVTACYRCVFEQPPPPDDVPSCQDAGVLGPVVALAGSLQAAEALRIARGERPLFADRLLSIDLRAGTWRSVPVARSAHCPACGSAAYPESGTNEPSVREPS